MKKILTIILTVTALMVLPVSSQFDVSAEKADTPLQTKPNSLGNVSPDCEKIIFTSRRENGKTDIVLMNPDGSGKIGLLPANLSATNPQITPAGETFVLSIFSKRYVFSPNTKAISVTDDLLNADWIAEN